jgi:hypothetical protein
MTPPRPPLVRPLVARPVAALALTATALLGVAACGDDSPDVSGDSITEDSQQEAPTPLPS